MTEPAWQHHQVRTEACQLNPGQREEANICFNITASSQRRLGSGLTPGLTTLPDHIFRDKAEEMQRKGLKVWKAPGFFFAENLFSRSVKANSDLNRAREKEEVWPARRFCCQRQTGRSDWLQAVDGGSCQAPYLESGVCVGGGHNVCFLHRC